MNKNKLENALKNFDSAYDIDFLYGISHRNPSFVTIGRLIDLCSDFKDFKELIGNDKKRQWNAICEIWNQLDIDCEGANIYDAVRYISDKYLYPEEYFEEFDDEDKDEEVNYIDSKDYIMIDLPKPMSYKEFSKRLLLLEVTTDHVVKHFEEMNNRKPTNSELGKILDKIGDLYNRLKIEYVCEDIRQIICSEIESLGFEA